MVITWTEGKWYDTAEIWPFDLTSALPETRHTVYTYTDFDAVASCCSSLACSFHFKRSNFQITW